MKGDRGIYQIRCLANGKVYIGSAINIQKRWNEHRRHLGNGNHHSRYLQRAWLKYGSEQFVFEILEVVVNPNNLICHEQSWLDRIQPFKRKIGYNTCRVAGSTLGFKQHPEVVARLAMARRGKKRSPEAIAKTVAARKGKPLSAAACARISDAARRRKYTPEGLAKRILATSLTHKGKPKSPETRAKMSAALKGVSRPYARELAARMAESNRGKPLSEKHRAAVSVALKGHKVSPETRAKISATRKRRHGQLLFTFMD